MPTWRRRIDAVPSPATPTGLAIGIGAVAIVVAGIVAAMTPVADPDWRFAVMAIAVGLFAAISLNQIALAAVAVLAFAISNGFLEDRFGQLSWHGSGDLWRVLLLVMAAALGLAIGEAVRFVAGLRPRLAGVIDVPAGGAIHHARGWSSREVAPDDHAPHALAPDGFARDGLAPPDLAPSWWSVDTAFAARFGIVTQPAGRAGAMPGAAPGPNSGRDELAAQDVRDARSSGDFAWEDRPSAPRTRRPSREEKHGA